jgi:adenosylcobinamide kinase/adenosylcobinamide-phosphate guanylyltransferase
MYTFVTGGYRSGRSNYALRRASELGPPPWLYVTAGGEADDSIRKRLERYRRDKEAIWTSGTMPDDLKKLVAPGAFDGYGAAIIDGYQAWLEKRLAASPNEADSSIIDEVGAFVDQLYRLSTPVVLVSTEMGGGVVPEKPHQQRFVKLLASANQMLASQAGAVVLLVAGVPLRLR